jgi:hypothetical protein
MITRFTVISNKLIWTATHVAIDQIMADSTVFAWIRFAFIYFFYAKFSKKIIILKISTIINIPISQKVPRKPVFAQLQA